MTLKVLHITPWFPGEHDPYEALFIQEHINALNLFCENSVICIKLQDSDHQLFTVTHIGSHPFLEFFVCKTRLNRTIFFEWIGFIMLFWLLVVKKRQKGFDIINMHIAYPLCVYLKYMRKWIHKPLILTEHWSIYKYSFYINRKKKGLKHIRDMFSSKLPLITVSESLFNDIVDFSGKDHLIHSVMPNAVNTHIFHYNPSASVPEYPVFVMINKWNNIKKPVIIIEAFEQFIITYPNAQLTIGGYGPLWDEIIQTVQVKSLDKHIKLVGKLKKTDIANLLQRSTALLQASDYETFSVICAESICCGTPVIASNVGGIPSFINDSNGLLIKSESVEAWRDAMETVFTTPTLFNRKEISKEACSKFSMQQVGQQYYKLLQRYCNK